MASTQQLTVTANFASGDSQDVTADASYESSATGVATVSATGLITAVAAGSATVTATYGGQSGTCDVTVTDSVEGLSVSPTTAALDVEAA